MNPPMLIGYIATLLPILQTSCLGAQPPTTYGIKVMEIGSLHHHYGHVVNRHLHYLQQQPLQQNLFLWFPQGQIQEGWGLGGGGGGGGACQLYCITFKVSGK